MIILIVELLFFLYIGIKGCKQKEVINIENIQAVAADKMKMVETRMRESQWIMYGVIGALVLVFGIFIYCFWKKLKHRNNRNQVFRHGSRFARRLSSMVSRDQRRVENANYNIPEGKVDIMTKRRNSYYGP